MEQHEEIRRLIGFELDQRLAAAIGPAIRAEFDALKSEAMQEGGDVERYLGLITNNVLRVVREEVGDTEKIARLAVGIAKSEIAVAVTEAQAAVNAGAPPGGDTPPGGGDSGGNAGGGPQPEPTPQPATAAAAAPGTDPSNDRMGARVVESIKRDPNGVAEVVWGWVERIIDLADRRKNPFVEIDRLRNDPTGIGALALQSQTPGFLDQANTASQIWSLGFRSGQGGKQLAAAPNPAASIPSAPSSAQPPQSAAAPSVQPQPSAPVAVSPLPSSEANHEVMAAAMPMATAPPSQTATQPSEASGPARSYRMSDLA